MFKLETFFNPASGNISDALKSLTQNNGKPLKEQSTNIDSSIAGQAFQQSFVGIELAHLRNDHVRPPEHAARGRHREV